MESAIGAIGGDSYGGEGKPPPPQRSTSHEWGARARSGCRERRTAVACGRPHSSREGDGNAHARRASLEARVEGDIADRRRFSRVRPPEGEDGAATTTRHLATLTDGGSGQGRARRQKEAATTSSDAKKKEIGDLVAEASPDGCSSLTLKTKTKPVAVDTVVCLVSHLKEESSWWRRRWQFLYPPHLLALLFTCPVFTFAGEMLSTVGSKGPAEVFASSLKAKLSLVSCEENPKRQREGSADRMVANGSTLEREDFSYPGTTFPPVRCARFDQLRAKYHSESDLTPAAATEDGAEFFKSKFHSQNREDDEGNDSDLFFDFDIGTPDEDEEDVGESASAKGIPLGQTSQRGHRRSGSDESLDYYCPSTSSGIDSRSTGFGSTSSGLFSDVGNGSGPYEDDEDDGDQIGRALDVGEMGGDCLSLEPQDWLRRQKLLGLDFGTAAAAASSPSNCSTPIATQSPSNSASSPLISPDSLLDGEDNVVDDVDVGREDQSNSLKKEANSSKKYDCQANNVSGGGEDDEDFTVYTGDHKHKIAHSKLNALIALLEKDRTYAKNTSPVKETRSAEEPSTRRHSHDEFGQHGRSIPGSPTKRSGFKCSLPTIAASPANFSFLSAAPSEAPKEEKEPASACSFVDQSTSAAATVMKRSESTPTLTFVERELIQSPQLARKNGTVNSHPAATARNAVKEPEAETSGLKYVDVPEKPELRRASSLKTGKTPPGTPGRRKIVR